VSPVKYELGFYIPEDDILHSRHRDNPKSYNEFGFLVSGSTLCPSAFPFHQQAHTGAEPQNFPQQEVLSATCLQKTWSHVLHSN
jgi:hypothetical protein